jgi:hypothetical protein
MSITQQSVETSARQAREGGESILRLAPTWVPRIYLQPGRRLKLDPRDLYAYGAHRGEIDESRFASTTPAMNDNRTLDEGLSYVVAEGQRFTLKEAIEAEGQPMIARAMWDTYHRWPVYSKFFDNSGPIAPLAASEMAKVPGNAALSTEDRRLAIRIQDTMEKYLANQDGSWIWCIDVNTMIPDRAVLDSAPNREFGGLNGIASMYADVLGLQPLASHWNGIGHSEKTFRRLYDTPLREQEFTRYGIWTQFDLRGGGMLASPSYGEGYAIQTMLLFDKLDTAEKALSRLANATYSPIPEYKLHRASPYYFFERMYSPGAVGKVAPEEGCGALNLANVSKPLKVSRLMLGVDDSSLETVRVIPRVPDHWKGMEACNWPIRSRSGVVRAEIHFERRGTGGEFTLKLSAGQQIDDLKVRMPSKNGFVGREVKHCGAVHFATQ